MGAAAPSGAVPGAEVLGDAGAAVAADGTGPAWARGSLDQSVDGQCLAAHEATPTLAAQEEAGPRRETGRAGTGSGGDGGAKGLEGEAAAAAAVVAGSRTHEAHERDEGEKSGEVQEEEDGD